MPPTLEKCAACPREVYPNQLVYSIRHGSKVCLSCLTYQGIGPRTHGEIQAEKSRAAKATAWNGGKGWE